MAKTTSATTATLTSPTYTTSGSVEDLSPTISSSSRAFNNSNSMKFVSDLSHGGTTSTGLSSLLSVLPPGGPLLPREGQIQIGTSSAGHPSSTDSNMTYIHSPSGGSTSTTTRKMMVDPIAPTPTTTSGGSTTTDMVYSSPSSFSSTPKPISLVRTSSLSSSSPCPSTLTLSSMSTTTTTASASSLPLKSLGNMYLFGYTSFDDLSCPDILNFVNEHATTLNFPQKLMLMLTYAEKSDDRQEKNGIVLSSILSWTKDGTAFVIKRKKEFLEQLLPMFFQKSDKFPSFTRKLYRWGFRQISHLPGEIPKSRTSMIFGHEYFQRDAKSLIIHMKSITAAGTRRAMAKAAAQKKVVQEENDVAASAAMMMAVEQPPKQEHIQLPHLHSSRGSDKMKGPTNSNNMQVAVNGGEADKKLPLATSFLQPKPLSWFIGEKVTPRLPNFDDIMNQQVKLTSHDSFVLSPGSFFKNSNTASSSTSEVKSKDSAGGVGTITNGSGNGNPTLHESLLSSALAISRANGISSDGGNDATTRLLASLAAIKHTEALLASLRSTPGSFLPSMSATHSSAPSAQEETADHAMGESTSTGEMPTPWQTGGTTNQDMLGPSTTAVDRDQYHRHDMSTFASKGIEDEPTSSLVPTTEPVLEAVHALLRFSS